MELDPVVVYSYNNDQFAEAADRNTSIYVSKQAIEAAEMGTLRDVFSEEASVTVGGGIPIAQKIFVNGLDALTLNMTIEGAMQNNRAFHHALSPVSRTDVLSGRAAPRRAARRPLRRRWTGASYKTKCKFNELRC
ncbi:hypothetical protein [Flexibacterium corallicola]|uniref:hypothetical protein n=1 Tax=Flexibacterium corallicola TaxID=3037259 RepID=UPI00286F8CDF|nr:hypothetical protein [Pseudovibrio sp. M1P-2-3]